MDHTTAQFTFNSRRAPRLKLPAMYTLVRVRPVGERAYPWTGYIYDVSQHGMRFELDEALEPGTRVDVRAVLPGGRPVTFRATGRVVRLHDDADDPGPIRMGMAFEAFDEDADAVQLDGYLSGNGLRDAA